VGLSIGSVSFAYQAGANSSTTGQAAVSGNNTSATPFVIGTPGPEDCPEGTIWHPVMGHCMTPEAIAALQNAQCPAGYALDPNLLTCLPSSLTREGTPAVTSGSATAVCPNGFFWHPAMDHCMETSSVVCPAGFQWSIAQLSCVATSSGGTITTPAPNETPVCPGGTFWHPVMEHCMSNQCPPGFQFDYQYLTCLQVSRPTTTPQPTGTPQPTTDPGTPTPECQTYFVWDPVQGACVFPTPAPETPTPPPGEECPSGFFWHPAMGHCMSYDCPPGLVFDYETLYCVLPADVGSPTATATPEPHATPTSPPGVTCPDGYFWNENKGHCDYSDCPPGLVYNWDTLYCELPSTPPPLPTPSPQPTATPATPTPQPTATPPPEEETPSCPAGFFWHPAMGHCMSYTCPPGLVFDYDTLYCVLPDF
jgi:hypothetical protein